MSWHSPLPNPAFDPGRPYEPDNSPFSTCQRCGESWPCAEARYDAGPIAVSGIWLRDGAEPGEIEVLAEVDGQWRTVIRQRVEPDGITSHIVEPLGIRYGKPDRLASRDQEGTE